MIFLKRRALMTRVSFNYKTVNGIGSITLENCVETKFKRLVLSGNSKQTSTKGLQLLDIAKIPTPQAGLSYYNMQVEEGKYTLSTKYRRAVQKDLFLLAGEVNTGASSNVNGVDSTISRTVESINGYITIGYRNGENGVNPFDFETMLNKGDIPLPYEPYTGGKPSPSIEYQQEIINAGKLNEETSKYEIDVQVTGRNLINVDVLRNDNGYVTSSYATSRDINNFDIVQGKKYLLITKGKPLVSGEYSSIYFGGDDLKYGANDKNCLATGTGYICFSSGKQIRTILTAKKTCTITKMILHGKNYVKDGYEVEQLGLFEILEDNTNIDYEPYREPQTITIQLDRPLAKWDRIEKQDGVWGVAYKSKAVDDLSNLITGREIIYGNVGSKYFTIAIAGANFNYDKTKVFSEVGVNNGNYTPKINTGSFIIGINDTDTIETAKEHMHYKVIYETDSEEFVPLPEETQTILNSLHANDGTTVVTIDSGEAETGIEVEYAVKE